MAKNLYPTNNNGHMNGDIITDDMSLEEKLSAIERAMRTAQEQAREAAQKRGMEFVPIDPSQLTICDGCE